MSRCRTCGRASSRRHPVRRRGSAQPSMFWGRALIVVCVLLAVYAWGKGQG